MNVFGRLLLAIVSTMVAVAALISQRWALGHDSIDHGPMVTFSVSERLTQPTWLQPPVVLRPAFGPIDLPKDDALQRAANESGVRVVEPGYLPEWFTVRTVVVVNRWPKLSYVELAFSESDHGFVLRYETTPTRLGTLFLGHQRYQTP